MVIWNGTGVMTETNAVHGARYHAALAGKGMVSNLILPPVLLGFIVVHGCFSEHGTFYMESATAMLTDIKLRNLKPKEKLYKVNDRDGLYVAVTAAGSISFRYNYSINGRQETVTFGRYVASRTCRLHRWNDWLIRLTWG